MSFQDNTLTLYFVYQNGATDSDICDDMKQAAIYLNDYIDAERIKWIHETEAIDLVSVGELTKKDIFILEEFDGKVFDDLQTTPALIVGPRCLLVCLLDCAKIPLYTSPVYITAMRDLYICCSGFEVAQKDKMKTLISYMGGYYMKELNIECNYLISSTIKSTKYEQAVINSIPVMQAEWIDAVWRAGKTKSILATDIIFEKYKLPIFYGANISASGLSSSQRDEILKLVTENGGNFQKSFKSSSTDILIITKDGTTSEKYKAAIRYKKDVLLPEWIYDSVKKGFAIPFSAYAVKNVKNSTPTKSGPNLGDFTANCTQISGIYSGDISTNINDTVSSVNSSSRRPTRATTSANSIDTNYKKILSEISPQNAKKAGTFLDGCCIYLSGFTTEDKDKLNKILNVGGATRYNEINDKITHIIVGEVIASEFASWREQGIQSGAYIVTLHWIVESIKIKQPAYELKYRAKLPIHREPEAPSPQSKKSLHSLNNSFKKPELPKKRLNFQSTTDNEMLTHKDTNDIENNFLTHYSQENNMSAANLTLSDLPAAPKSVKLNESKKSKMDKDPIAPIEKLPSVSLNNCTNEFSMTTEEYENLNFFDGLTIFIVKNYDEEIYSQTIVDCETARGKVVTTSYRDCVDYVIVSSEIPIDINLLPVKAKNIVNSIWLEDAIQTNELVDIEYYHKPISIMANKKPLTGLIIVISAYAKHERLFLQSLVTILGAKCKDSYEKRDKPLLVCPSPTTDKYNAALKWNNPAVNSEWLVRCSETGVIEDMNPYLVGDTKVTDYFIQLFKDTPKSSNPKKPSHISEQIHTEKNQDEELSEDVMAYTPLRHKRISELAGRSDFTTPENKFSNVRTNETDSPIFGDIDELLSDIESLEVREFCKQALLDAQNRQTPELERLKKLTRTPNLEKSPVTPHVPDFCRTPEYRKRMLDYLDKRWHLSIKKLKPDTPLAEIKMRLWRETLPQEFVATCKYFQDYQSPQQSKKPDHPQASTSFNSSLVKNVPKTSTTTPPVSPAADHRTMFDDENENASPAVKRLKDYLKICEEERKNSSSKKNIIENTPLEEETQGLPQRFESEMMFNSERMVGWGDPSDFKLSRRNKVNPMKFQGIPKFNISANPNLDKNELCQRIKQLRGEVCENLNSYDPTCTHIVCEKPNRSEKLLSSVASGKWILSLNYIMDSYKQGYFLDEELYEWGNPKAKNLPELQETEQAIANAYYCWHQKISSHPDIRGAFTGQKIILHVTNKALPSLTTVIIAGDGIVLPASSPFDHSTFLQATHCYVDVRNSPLNKNDHAQLIESGIHVLDFIFISKYLTSDPDADLHKYTLSL